MYGNGNTKRLLATGRSGMDELTMLLLGLGVGFVLGVVFMISYPLKG